MDGYCAAGCVRIEAPAQERGAATFDAIDVSDRLLRLGEGGEPQKKERE
jgi:hypothetical protein